MICLFKKTFLKDLAELPDTHRKKIEKLVFEDIPNLKDIRTISISGKCRDTIAITESK